MDSDGFNKGPSPLLNPAFDAWGYTPLGHAEMGVLIPFG